MIIYAFRMLSAIGFNDELIFDASKIGYKFANRMLSAKFKTSKAAIAKAQPKFPLGIR